MQCNTVSVGGVEELVRLFYFYFSFKKALINLMIFVVDKKMQKSTITTTKNKFLRGNWATFRGTNKMSTAYILFSFMIIWFFLLIPPHFASLNPNFTLKLLTRSKICISLGSVFDAIYFIWDLFIEIKYSLIELAITEAWHYFYETIKKRKITD